jgi:hypothetical protein
LMIERLPAVEALSLAPSEVAPLPN